MSMNSDNHFHVISTDRDGAVGDDINVGVEGSAWPRHRYRMWMLRMSGPDSAVEDANPFAEF